MGSRPRQGSPDGRAAAAHTPAAGRKNTRTVEGYHSDTYTKKPGAQRLSEGYTQPNDTRRLSERCGTGVFGAVRGDFRVRSVDDGTRLGSEDVDGHRTYPQPRARGARGSSSSSSRRAEGVPPPPLRRLSERCGTGGFGAVRGDFRVRSVDDGTRLGSCLAQHTRDPEASRRSYSSASKSASKGKRKR